MRKRMGPDGHACALSHSDPCVPVVNSGELKWR